MLLGDEIFDEIQSVDTDGLADGNEGVYDALEERAALDLMEERYDPEEHGGIAFDDLREEDPDTYFDLLDKARDEADTDFISVKRVSTGGVLFKALRRYLYGSYDSVIKHVRNAVEDDGWMYYVTGCGYDTTAYDLLNGRDGDVRGRFLKAVNDDEPLPEAAGYKAETEAKSED